MKRMAIVVALAMEASVHPCATYAESVDFAKAPPAGQHCIYDAVPLDGAWEMSYCSNAWDSVACPKFKGVAVAKAVPGFWENMVPAFRAAGMKDAFRINPVYERQTIPMTQWAKCTTLPTIYGCFLYRRTFTLDTKSFRFGGRGAPALPPAYLAFDCVRNQVHAWVNGKFVAFRQGFSTPFELPIPNGVLREGKNEIVLAVSNNPNKGYNGSEVSGLTTRGLFEATGGIDGRLELRFAGNGIRDVYVTTAKDLKTFTVHVGDDGRVEQVDGGKNNVHVEHVERVDGRKILYEIKDAGGAVVAKGETKGNFTLPTKGFSFWSPENPVRYTLTLTTPEGTCSQKFGIRRLVPDGERMRLNGELMYLRGVTEHCYFPETVQLPRDLAYYRTITARRKELGFNFLRFHTFVPPDEYLEAMDELGIMVHIESPNFVTLEEYDAIIRFARKHPCVVAYCTGNETWIDETAEKYLESVAKLVHAETDSLFTPMSAMRNVEYMVRRGKDTANKPFLHVPSRMARLAAYSDYFTSYQLGAVSYDSLNGASAATIDAWGDAYCGKPRTMHETCIDGSFCDITLEKDYPKDSPITKEGVFSEVRRHLTERGLLDRAPAYVRNSGEWMRRIRKFTFEKVRASRRIVGYDFLGDIDSRWHTFGYSDGMMDEFYRLKHGETVENVRRYNSAAVLLCSLGSDFNFKAGEKRRVAFTISNFAGDAKEGVVKVSLVACRSGDDSHAEAQRGRERRECAGCVWSDDRKVKDVKNGDIAAIGEFEVAIPVADKPTKYLLRASFAGGAVKAENEWEVYAFPEVGSRVPRDRMPCRIVSSISRDDLLAAMGRGERVLLLGKGPFKSLRTSFRIGLAGRTSGHYATIIKPGHPALEGMPHEGFCGWQFRRLMQNGAAVQLEAGVPFDPIVEVAASDKYLIRQAMLFEYKVGEGRLLVCSFAFGAKDPAAAWLKARLEAYAASDAFNPKQSLTPDQLCAVIDAPLFSAEANKNVALNPDDPASYAKPAAERMDRSKLLIGAYCLQANAKTDAHIKAIHDCGVDFIIGGLPASDRATLDIFAKHGVGAIVNGVVPGWWGGDGKRAGKMRETNPPEKYAAGAAAFKDHPAIWAIDIGDEPSALDFPYYGDVVRQLNKAIPGMPLYLNLYPNYASVAQNNGKQTINQLGTKTYAEHVDVYCREVPLDYISYDFYPYMASSGGTDRFLSKMYDNFIVVSEACRRTKRSFWYVPQVNSRGGLPPTSENRLRFQANAALSFGAEAITWACWCKGWWTNNVIDVTGKQTEQYGKLKRVNAELKQVGLHYMRFRNVATRLVGFAPDSPRRPRLPYSGAPDDPGYVKASNGAPLIVGEMVARDPACGERAYFVTAADDPADAHPATFDIVFNVKAKRVEAFGGSGAIPVSRRPDGSCAVPLASCQGVLIVVQ